MAEEDGRGDKKSKQGGFKTMPFILATEGCDRIATSGLYVNLISYLTRQMHMPLARGANTVTLTKGTASFTPIVGGLIADSFAGGFWTIFGGSIFYLLGLIILTISAVVPMLHPPSCSGDETCKQASGFQLFILYISLLLTTIGSGGIRPCVSSFGADQFNNDGPKMEAHKRTFFNLYFIVMRFATGVAIVVVVYVQENVGWGWGLNIPTMCMFVSIVTFVVGYSFYIKPEPKGSPLTRVAQVVVAAIRKRKVARPSEVSRLYENRELDAGISTTGKLVHTNKLSFLDKAAVVTEGDKKATGEEVRLWRLATVHRVEEVKSIIRIIPVWAVGIMFIATASNIGSFAIHQARTMDRRLTKHYQIPPATMSFFLDLSTILTLIFYSRVFVPLARRYTGRPSGITPLQRMLIGTVFSMLCYVTAALVEIKRKKVAAEHGLLDKPKAILPISVFWLAFQYIIYGMAESFLAVGQMEFLYDQAPESMRSIAVAMYWLAIALGDYVSTGIVSLVGHLTNGVWLQDNINRGKIDYYWWLMTGLEFLNFVYLIICTKFYTFKKSEKLAPENEACNGESEEEGDGYLKLMDGSERKVHRGNVGRL